MKLYTGVNERELEALIDERIHEIEQPAYRFPSRFKRRDYIFVAAAAVICFFMLIRGYYL